MYYIYRLIGLPKIGVTDNVKRRMIRHKKRYKDQYNGYEILEEHTCIDTVDRREKELQAEYGYPVDQSTYSRTISLRNVGKNASVVKTRALTMQQAREIRSIYTPSESGATLKGGISQLAREYGVTRALIRGIVTNKTYKDE